ncbi:hypothetical protein pneo_cds_897 [Pandoravirus neocaledonia]|uniref:Uncharacterized protein n=1 Tax=Pandoravirus neocaledonia TaxID=2107708 RepID=A0A2U7UDI4_9VIRU|nr:hypothetical protein pneo_cds_897 [Pandoravirus neocaledonia]AVK76504.1 hypothetical protein pneo_cds_897 [Pandoravirus neocaledonia]
MSIEPWRNDALVDACGMHANLYSNAVCIYQTTCVDHDDALLRIAPPGQRLLHSRGDMAHGVNDCCVTPSFILDTANEAGGDGGCGNNNGDGDGDDDDNTEACDSAPDDSGSTDDDDDDESSDKDDNSQCPVAPPHTAYAYGYTFIEGFMPADWFDALVRPERRLVLLVCGVPVAVDAAEVERAARVDRSLVTPVGSCRLGPTDVERAHEVDESLYGREGIRRALAPVPLAATLEAVGAPAAEAAGGVGGAVLAGILAALL